MPGAEDFTVICPPVAETQPTKVIGGAKMYINKCYEGRQAMRIELPAGFNWRESVKPMLPGCPDWCPATHFGYLESGEMGIEMEDGSKRVIKAGETYLVPPGHLPIIEKDTVMIEFSQDTTYTNKEFLEKKEGGAEEKK